MKFFLVSLLVAGVQSQYAASLLGNVALTTVEGTEASGDLGSNVVLPVGTNVVGPFEAGFTSQQDFILEAMGCATGKGYVDAGLDTEIAEKLVAHDCGVELPRWEGEQFISLLGSCGGHTQDYHFHERFSCLYSASGGHSTQVAEGFDGKFVYGMWEDTDNQIAPLLDACGGHWGPTPDSDVDTYHYHVQAHAPYSIGCYGPNPDNSLVTVEQCRALYDTCDGDLQTYNWGEGDVSYDLFCPCYDANGSNTGVDIAPLPVFATDAAAGPGGESVAQEPTTSSTSEKEGMDSSTKEGMDSSTSDKEGMDSSTSDKEGMDSSTSEKEGMDSSTKEGMDSSTSSSTSKKEGMRAITSSSAEGGCHSTNFEVRGGLGKMRNMCLDASAKRAKFASCNGKAEQQFSVRDGQIMRVSDGHCLSPTTTFGACGKKAHTFNQMGSHHQIKLSTGKCLALVNGKLRTAKCNPKGPAQKFSFVGLF